MYMYYDWTIMCSSLCVYTCIMIELQCVVVYIHVLWLNIQCVVVYIHVLWLNYNV